MAFPALILNGKSILTLVMAGSTRLAIFHVCHAGLESVGFEVENLGMTVGTVIGLQVELVAEGGFSAGSLPCYFTRFHALMTLVAVAGDGKGILAVVAGAAGSAFGHVSHGRLAGYNLVRECFGVAVFARVCLSMEGMTEGCRSCTFERKGNVLGFESFVATVTVGGYREGLLAVVAGSAGFSFLHLIHGDRFFLAGDNIAIVAALAGSTCLDNVYLMTENGISQSFDPVGYISRFAFVAFDAVFLRCHAERLYSGMAGTTGFGFFHLRHGNVFAVTQVEDGIVAHFAIIIVFF